MNVFLIASVLWIIMLLGAWLLVGRSLRRACGVSRWEGDAKIVKSRPGIRRSRDARQAPPSVQPDPFHSS